MDAPPAHRPGFTLIELMLAVTMLAIIAGGMALALSTSLRATEAIRARGDAADERRVLVQRLRADLEGAWVRPGSQTTWLRGGDISGAFVESGASRGDLLELTTSRAIPAEIVTAEAESGPTAGAQSPDRAPRSDVAQVTWQLEHAGDGTMALVRRERMPPDAELAQTQGVDAAVTPAVYLRDVADFNVRFFDGTQWVESWDTLPATDTGDETGVEPIGAPMAVEVTISFGGDAAIAAVSPRRDDRSSGTPPLTLVVALPAEASATAEGASGAP